MGLICEDRWAWLVVHHPEVVRFIIVTRLARCRSTRVVKLWSEVYERDDLPEFFL